MRKATSVFSRKSFVVLGAVLIAGPLVIVACTDGINNDLNGNTPGITNGNGNILSSTGGMSYTTQLFPAGSTGNIGWMAVQVDSAGANPANYVSWAQQWKGQGVRVGIWMAPGNIGYLAAADLASAFTGALNLDVMIADFEGPTDGTFVQRYESDVTAYRQSRNLALGISTPPGHADWFEQATAGASEYWRDMVQGYYGSPLPDMTPACPYPVSNPGSVCLNASQGGALQVGQGTTTPMSKKQITIGGDNTGAGWQPGQLSKYMDYTKSAYGMDGGGAIGANFWTVDMFGSLSNGAFNNACGTMLSKGIALPRGNFPPPN